MRLRYSHHDAMLPEAAAAVVDQGIGDSNELAAPLHEVQPLAVFAHAGGSDGEVIGGVTDGVIGGAVGRRWGAACELQQLWVHPAHRQRGIGTRLLRDFEALAAQAGCTQAYLETFSFQAPEFYRRLGWVAVHGNNRFPHGICKWVMERELAPPSTPAAG